MDLTTRDAMFFAGFCVVLSTVLSVLQIRAHLLYNLNPWLRKYTIR
jgi:hypothetical protein